MCCAAVIAAPASGGQVTTHKPSAALAAEPAVDGTQVRVAQVLLERGDAHAAEMAAKEALRVLPKFPALYLVGAEAMQREGKEYAARQLLIQGLSITGSIDILSRLAAIEDTHGEGAAGLYARLADSSQLSGQAQLTALERGFKVALRDGELEQAKGLAARLETRGHPEFNSLLNEEAETGGGETFIRGGPEGLGYMAMVTKGISSRNFLAEYARALLGNVCTGICFGPDEYKKSIADYFQTVSDLESTGTRDHHRVQIRMSLANADERRRTEGVLDLLGIVLHFDKGVIRLEEGVKPRQATHQQTVAALGVDVIGMEKALQSGKSYTLEIDDAPVEIYPDAEMWKEAFPKDWRDDFAEMLLHSPKIARLYVSISGMDRHTLGALLDNVSPVELATRFADELARYGPAFAVADQQAVVPGGIRAGPVWAKLAGVGPDEPGLFFRTLLETPSLLSLYYELSELDAQHQAFFTANADRALRFYTISKAVPANGEYEKNLATETSFARLLRSVPLDGQGHVIFPGSAGVWLVAKGAETGDNRISALEKEARRAAPVPLEDAVLSHLSETQYRVAGLKSSELDNFLAVSRLNEHLKEPMDEPSAILLAQHYFEGWPLYAYFSDLPGVNDIGLNHFFSIIDQIQHKPPLVENVEMGQLYALLGWVSILGRTQALSGSQMAQLYSQIGAAMQAALNHGSMAAASLSLAASIADMCGGNRDGGLDEAIRTCMAGPSSPPDDASSVDFQRVLELQKSPSLDALETIAQGAQSIAGTEVIPSQVPKSGTGGTHIASTLRAETQRIAEAASHLPTVEVPKDHRVRILEREWIEVYDPAGIRKCAAELDRIAAQSNPDRKAASRKARELLSAIAPQVTVALAGPIYAYYLRSTDLIAEDPLLLRKHRYVDFLAPEGGKRLLEVPAFFPSSEGVGSHFAGGFADFGLIAGRAAAPGFREGGHGALAIIGAQLAAIRSTPWNRIDEQDQRLAALRILGGREWIVDAADEGKYFEVLSEALQGLLSPARRADLLNSLRHRDWNSVWASMPLPDLYMLGSKFSSYSLPESDSPVFRELRRLENSGLRSNVNYLGHISFVAYGCGHLHLLPDAPYEGYARRLLADDLAERAADLKLYLAVRADNLGIEPRTWGPVAEKLAARAFAASELNDYHDWRSLFAAYNAITTNDLKKALEP